MDTIEERRLFFLCHHRRLLLLLVSFILYNWKKKSNNHKTRGTDFGGDYPRTTGTLHPRRAEYNMVDVFCFVSICPTIMLLYEVPIYLIYLPFFFVWVLRAYVWYISMFSSTLTATVVYTLHVVVLYAHVCPESLQPFNVLNSNKQPLENVWKNKKTIYNNTLDEQAVYIRKVKITRTATECVLFWK